MRKQTKWNFHTKKDSWKNRAWFFLLQFEFVSFCSSVDTLLRVQEVIQWLILKTYSIPAFLQLLSRIQSREKCWGINKYQRSMRTAIMEVGVHLPGSQSIKAAYFHGPLQGPTWFVFFILKWGCNILEPSDFMKPRSILEDWCFWNRCKSERGDRYTFLGNQKRIKISTVELVTN